MTMKKLSRSDATIDYIKIFADYSQKHGITEYSEAAIKKFGDSVQQAITATATSEHRIRGLRAEALFLAVVAGIGKVLFIKAEDVGETYYGGKELSIPDFRVVTADHGQMLIEVKVQHIDGSFGKECKLSDRYIRRLRNYSELTNTEFRIAIFWEEICVWTLNRLEAFTAGQAGERQWSISFPRAMATNEMMFVGDCTVATLPPLRFRVLLDTDKSDPIPPNGRGNVKVTVDGIQLLSQDRILTGLAEQIAWKLLCYGVWGELDKELNHDDDKLLWIDHIYGPPHLEGCASDPTQPARIGELSQMISAVYLRGAERTIHTNARDDAIEPSYMGNFIPDNFVSLKLELPLYKFYLQPNFAEKAAMLRQHAGSE